MDLTPIMGAVHCTFARYDSSFFPLGLKDSSTEGFKQTPITSAKSTNSESIFEDTV